MMISKETDKWEFPQLYFKHFYNDEPETIEKYAHFIQADKILNVSK